jgi:5,10-methylenetetrahydromethanopterin reductase
MLEVWATGAGVPGLAARHAAAAEKAGYDGLALVDSQNLAGDCYVGLALAAKATSRLRLATGVTNPVTRHPAATAAAIAAVHAESGGRAVLGFGRGDSALAHLGYAPASPAVFERALARIQAYLRGEEVPFEPDGNLATLGLADGPRASRLTWLPQGLPKVPVDVAATGPRTIAIAARLAERVSFAVGADPARIRWAIETARAARRAAGLDPAGLSLGAWLNVVVHDDPDQARRLGEGGLALFARFSAMHGTPVGPASAEDQALLRKVHDAYDMNRHARTGSPQAALLGGDFAERFAVYGPPARVIARLRELLALGLERVIVVGASVGADREQALACEARFVREVLPALRTPAEAPAGR